MFRAGARPDIAAVRRAVEAMEKVAISHAGDEQGAGADEHGPWLELLIDGMTFDLSGMAPGAGYVAADLRNRYEVPADFGEALGEGLCLLPGPHLAGGRATVPVVRAQAALGAELVRRLPGALVVSWTPARTLVGREFYLSMVEAWLAGGSFPALGLCAFRQMLGGAVQSEGLAFFTGQELHFDNAQFPDPAAAVQLGLRLVNELVGGGRIAETVSLTGPDGAGVTLRPSGNGRFLRVERG
ncbi:hypothetical protein [Pelagerythrobacter aerophilus]|uniref:Uncharacterized protein n=1 Tax=Pelagerythrobacter aerophilus TaxID=2306995 RepID=A0A418NJE8_9SPHN|nr:hypothetical protein [Pelagerythrobacter aerophilus]RIV79487.1 hypothetical protein D2V04_05745 [Pelagerythrobacter aerophilus]